MHAAADNEPADMPSAPQISNWSDRTRVKQSDEPGENETTPLLWPRQATVTAKTPQLAPSTMKASAARPRTELSRGRFWVLFSQILATQFLCYFDTTIMVSSHPVISSYFGVAHSASWLSTAFMVMSTVSQPFLGRLSDACGRKPLFLGTLVIFVLATLWCALANSIESLIAARAVCGIGAGGTMLMGSIMMSDMIPIEYVSFDWSFFPFFPSMQE